MAAAKKTSAQEDLFQQMRENGGVVPTGYAYNPRGNPAFTSLADANLKPDAEPPQNEDARESDAILLNGITTNPVALADANLKPDAEPPQNEDARESDAILLNGITTNPVAPANANLKPDGGNAPA